MSELHPQAKWFLEQIQAQNRPPWHEMTPEEARSLFGEMVGSFGHGPEMHAVRDEVLDGPRQVAMRIYRPQAGTLPAMVYFHGGGWVLGNLQTHDSLCRRLAAATNHVVVAVDYGLAPENKYPCAVDDAFRATRFVAETAPRLDIDPQRLVVAGDSAGGNLAAAVSLMARDQGQLNIHRQVLIYPVIDCDFETNSYTDLAEGYGLTRTTMQWFWELYLNDSVGDPKYARLANCNVVDLPDAFVLTAEFDVLRDEGEQFAKHLEFGNNRVHLKRYSGMLHGFIHYGAIFDDAATAVSDIAEWLER